MDLARALEDYQRLPLYISFAKKYPESFFKKDLRTSKGNSTSYCCLWSDNGDYWGRY